MLRPCSPKRPATITPRVAPYLARNGIAGYPPACALMNNRDSVGDRKALTLEATGLPYQTVPPKAKATIGGAPHARVYIENKGDTGSAKYGGGVNLRRLSLRAESSASVTTWQVADQTAL